MYNPAHWRKLLKTWFKQDNRFPISGAILSEIAVWLHDVSTPTFEEVFFQAAFFFLSHLV